MSRYVETCPIQTRGCGVVALEHECVDFLAYIVQSERIRVIFPGL